MTIFISRPERRLPYLKSGVRRRGARVLCARLISDKPGREGVIELHWFAAAIGLVGMKPTRLRKRDTAGEHYDVVGHRKIVAAHLAGAEQISNRDIRAKMRSKARRRKAA